MKRLLCLAAAAAVSFAAGCSNSGGGSTVTPPPNGNFSNSSLKGQYAFSMAGEDTQGGFISRVGSFIADGNGNITAGMEDVNDSGTFNTVVFSGGAYAISSNGKGTLTLNLNGAAALGFSVSLASTGSGFLTETDLNASSSGSFDLQSNGSFAVTGISNNYAFDVSGVDLGGAPLSIIGQLKTDGGGTITGGTVDINDGTTEFTSGNATFSSAAGGTYGADSGNVNSLTSFGRGVIQIAGLPIPNGTGAIILVFYIVDNTHFKMMEADSEGLVSGDAMLQSNVPTQTSSWTAGNFALLLGGAGVLGTAGPVAHASSFTTDGSGNLTNIFADDDNDGTTNSLSNSANVSGATYSIDNTNAGSGRGTMTITLSNSANPFTAVFYLASPGHGVIQDTSLGIIADGTLEAEGTGTVAAGNFAFNWTGANLVTNSNQTAFEEDFVGQYSTSASTTGANGSVDFVELGSNSTPVFTNAAVTVTGTLSATGSNFYTVVVAPSGAPSGTFYFRAYVTASGNIFLVTTDSSASGGSGSSAHVLTGVVTPQS